MRQQLAVHLHRAKHAQLLVPDRLQLHHGNQLRGLQHVHHQPKHLREQQRMLVQRHYPIHMHLHHGLFFRRQHQLRTDQSVPHWRQQWRLWYQLYVHLHGASNAQLHLPGRLHKPQRQQLRVDKSLRTQHVHLWLKLCVQQHWAQSLSLCVFQFVVLRQRAKWKLLSA